MEDLSDSGPKRLISGGAWFLGLMILSGVFWFFLGIQITNYYGPAGFGLFNTAYSMFDFMWALIFGGLFEGLIHFGTCHLTQNKENISQYFAKHVRYLTSISVIIFILLTFLSFQISDVIYRTIVLSLGVAFLFSGTKDALAAISGSLHNSKQLSITQSFGFYAVSIIGIIFTLLNMPQELLPILVIFNPISQLIVCMFFLRPYLKNLFMYNVEYFKNRKIKDSIFQDVKDFKKTLVFGFSISIGKISFMVMKSLDIPLLNLFFDITDVGIYSVADTISSIMFMMTAFALPIISSVSEAWTRKDNVLLEKYVKISIKYPLLLGLPLTVIIFALAEPIVVGLYGIEVQGAVVPLQILIVGTFLLMFGKTLTSILIGIGKPKLSGTLLAVAATQYLVLLFVFVPIFGLNGAAISLTCTGVTALVLIPYFIHRNLKVDVYSGIPKVVMAAIIMAAILLLFPKNNLLFLIAGTAVSVAIYGVMVYYSGYLTQEDIKILRKSKER
ncbi:MAG: polysaccharide biosynthesis C-terminal domain-containing protein [Candidatus Bathyarchaeota archaeon]|nr:MAG: polysaccharide biosynthesis C-terminal domain-containing protein [Candidatus Bathyarchaeota archaeon]